MLKYDNGIAYFDNKAKGGTFEAHVKVHAIERMSKRNAAKLMKLMHECAGDAEWTAFYEDAIAIADARTREAYEKASAKRKEPAMKRAKFYIMRKDKKNNNEVLPMDGYEFEAHTGAKFYVHRAYESKGWTITDPETGMNLGVFGATRAEVMKNAMTPKGREGKTVYDMVKDHRAKGKFAEHEEEFAKLTGKKEKPMNKTAKKTEPKKKERTTKKTAKKTTRKPAPKHEPKAVPAELRFRPIESPWKDVVITQKRPDACIWVSGKTGQCADELKALGYRYSRKRRAWWLKPEVA